MSTKQNNVLSILVLVFGIIGLVTSIIIIGLFPAIIGLILGIIALVKGQKKGRTIAGTVCSAIGILVSIVIFIITPASTQSGTVYENSSTVSEDPDSRSSDSASLADMVDTELYYFDSMGDTFAFVVATNNSEKTIDIDTNVTAKDSDGNVISTYSFNENTIGPGQSYPLWHFFEKVSASSIDNIDYSLTATESSNVSAVDNGLVCSTENITENGVIVKATNNSSEDIYFPTAYALFFENGNLVSFGDIYLDNVSSDCLLQSGQTVTKTIECLSNETFDDVKVYFKASK